jgi:sRNA-binding carbon storage regulator CsrA
LRDSQEGIGLGSEQKATFLDLNAGSTLPMDRNRVRVGIRAPKHIDIVRQELVEQEDKDV